MRHGASPPTRQSSHDDLRTIKTLLPYLWPAGESNLRFRVVVAIILLVGAKAVNVTVPLFYKEAVDLLSVDKEALAAVPIALLIGYGLTRFWRWLSANCATPYSPKSLKEPSARWP